MDDHDEILETLATPLDYLRLATSRFAAAGLAFGHGTDNSVDEARMLVLHALHLEPDAQDALLHGKLTRAEREAVLALIQRRIDERVPGAYLTREAWFAGLGFYVDERVLVPRSPVAELIEQGFAPWVDRPEQVRSVLDLCTGGGCIGIACAYAFPNARVDALDLSADALEVAAINVRNHGLEERVRLIESDLFSALGDERYDLIVSNPPYVSEAELDALPAEFHREPRLGLAAGVEGLDIVRRILEAAPAHLSEDGLLVVEVGNSAPATVAAWPALPFTWLDFQRGGDGVFALHAGDLRSASGESAIGSEVSG